MTLEQLRIFVAVADKQHVTQAARELNLTQSAVSAAIAALAWMMVASVSPARSPGAPKSTLRKT